MATFNGAQYLREQLVSVQTQSHRNWSLWISDDGSTDETLDIIREYKIAHPSSSINILQGPGLGGPRNFLSLLENSEIQADFYMFCDQDDVWFPEKLKRAISAPCATLEHPCLYGARTAVTDLTLAGKHASRLMAAPFGFKNALVQNFAGGNTMLFNNATRELARQQPLDFDVAAHDWFLYQLVSGVGGVVFYDSEPCLFYRQHGDNQIGDNAGAGAYLSRVKGLIGGRYKHWNAQNVTALARYAADFTDENRAALEAFVAARQSMGWTAFKGVRHGGFYRQTKLGTLALYLAAVISRI